ncbi:MAG TPA: hypothetical protein VMM60_04635 [Ilumatobacter sp.]|nr:hypothetical protein [Ilumatobacter sp.]
MSALPMEVAARPQRRVASTAATRPLTLGRDTHAIIDEFDLGE